MDPRYFEPIPASSNIEGKDQEINCEVRGKHLFRTLMVVNKEKMQYCYTHFRNLKEVNMEIILNSIIKTKTSNLNILDLKKTIYCYVCDPHKQMLFNNDKHLMIFEQNFCQDLLNSHSEYIMWINVYLVELFDQIYQTMQCFVTKGNEHGFPFVSKLDHYKRRMFFIKRCIENKDGQDFMFYCHFICSEFKFQSFSQIWDGNLQLLQDMAVEFHEFAKLMNLQKGMPMPEPLQMLMHFSLNRAKKTVEFNVGKGFT